MQDHQLIETYSRDSAKRSNQLARLKPLKPERKLSKPSQAQPSQPKQNPKINHRNEERKAVKQIGNSPLKRRINSPCNNYKLSKLFIVDILSISETGPRNPSLNSIYFSSISIDSKIISVRLGQVRWVRPSWSCRIALAPLAVVFFFPRKYKSCDTIDIFCVIANVSHNHRRRKCAAIASQSLIPV